MAGEDQNAALILTIESLAAGKGLHGDSHPARLLALYVPQGQPPSDFTPAGPFRATFEGDLNLRLRDTYTFFAEGRGELTLTINGHPVMESSGDDLSEKKSPSTRLNKGKNHLVAVYKSPSSGDASLRLFWSGRSFQAEPVNPSLFTHADEPSTLLQSLKVRNGRFLFAQFRCERCHTSAQKGMPELAMDVPSLSEAGRRLNEAWVAAWIADPKLLRPDTHMPRLFPAVTSSSAIEDIAAYLSSLGSVRANTPPGDANAGGRLFANLDCVACHTLPDQNPDPGRVPLRYVKAKFKPDALREYLLKPEAHYAWNPMPNFRLSDSEAADLSTFLLSLPGANLPNPHDGDSAKGKVLVQSSGCVNCHTIDSAKSTLQVSILNAITNDELGAGCLAATAEMRGKAPDFVLSADQREALAAFLATDRASLALGSAPEFAERQIAALRCTACHARDASESLLVQGLDAQVQRLHDRYPNPPAKEGETWAPDQRPPMLTLAGEKLRPQWMAAFISGELKYKPRYYLRARMPAFPARGQLIAAGLAEEHGCQPMLAPPAKPDATLAEAGRTLCGKVPNQGFSCVQCHAAGGEPPFAPFEAPSIDFKYVSERLRHDYYLRWMHDPLRIDPNSKMPRFDDAAGKTALPTFDGDAQKQFEAIWNYLLEGENLKPPPQ